MKNKQRKGINGLFRNSKFLLVFSVVLSVIIWMVVSLSDSNENSSTVTNIPIQINLSDEAVDSGLEIFSGAEQKAAVTVTGNRVALGSISSDDIIVSAQTAGTISTSGTYPLSLTARKANSSDNFNITSSVSPSVITIFVDHKRELSFDIENRIKYNVSDGYHAAVNLSSDEVTVSGPQTEISKIAKAVIDGEVKGELKDDTSIECDVKLYDNSGSELTNNMLTLSEEKITANFSVLPEKEVALKVNFKNAPTDLNIDDYVTVSPQKILIAAPKTVLDSLEYISTSEVDFRTLSNKKQKLNLEINLPANCVNLSDTEKVNVTIDLSSFKTKTCTVTDISVEGLDDAYSYSVSTESLSVTAVGRRDDLSNITSSDLSCKVEASDIDGTTGSITLPATVSITDSGSCWIYGTYKVNLYVTKNE